MSKLKFEKISDKQRYEKVIDFGREADTITIEGYYVDSIDIITHQMIDLFVQYEEQVTKIYKLTKACSNWFLSNLPPDLKKEEGKIYIPFNYMYNFDLVRVIPENGHKYLDSYLRVMKKYEWDKGFKSIEDDLICK